ncbi:MAG: hypothetical protein QM655_05280 [Nocardioidaceae bacterium]
MNRAPALVLLAAAVAALATGCSSDGSTPDASASSSPPVVTPTTASPSETPTLTESSSPSPTLTPTGSTTGSATPTTSPTTTPKLLDFSSLNNNSGAFVTGPKDIDQISTAPADFRAFVLKLAAKANKTGKQCPDAAHGVGIDMVRTDGFAVGGVNDCGGYRALWAKVDGTWKEIIGTQDEWDCGPLRKYKVPSVLVNGRCYDYDGDQEEHKYQQP